MEAGRDQIPSAPCAHGPREGIGTTLPRFMKNGLVLLSLNRAHVLHPTEIMHAVHERSPLRRARRSFPSRAKSSCLKVIVPEINVYRIKSAGLFAPQFAGGKADRINVLRFLAKTPGAGVRKFENAVVALDGADFAACVARQVRMSDGITRPDVLSGAKVRNSRHVSTGRIACGNHRRHFGSREYMAGLGVRPNCLSSCDLGRGEHASFQHEFDEAGQPFLEITLTQGFFWGDQLGLMAI